MWRGLCALAVAAVVFIISAAIMIITNILTIAFTVVGLSFVFYILKVEWTKYKSTQLEDTPPD